ncbi:MAG TPA: serine/threonine-protein kinase [Tepidisphaeraceae bacterium]|nr:serine/threonine-protein kinase [Tepidisphaeraceae bacterium]
MATIAPERNRPGMEEVAPKPSPDDIGVREAPRIYQQSIGKFQQPSPPQMGILAGKLGGYELKRKLGQGGMGTVYLARQISLDRDVAVKVLDTDLGRDAQFVSRFVREAYAAAQLVHHNVVQIHDIGEEQQTHFYSMEFVKGHSLADVIRTEGAIAPDTAAGYILQAARGLKIAHDQGMIHRDIKPENLLLSLDGIVKVADLGLVKRRDEQETAAAQTGPAREMSGMTLAKSTMGTPAYMAPEQAEDAGSVDARADIYSLGCTLFALLTGKPPFEGKTAEAVLEQAKTREVASPKALNPQVPSELSRIVHMMTMRNREERYANIGLVIRDAVLHQRARGAVTGFRRCCGPDRVAVLHALSAPATALWIAQEPLTGRPLFARQLTHCPYAIFSGQCKLCRDVELVGHPRGFRAVRGGRPDCALWHLRSPIGPMVSQHLPWLAQRDQGRPYVR